MKTNEEDLVKMAVKGEISPPIKGKNYKVSHEGEPFILPGLGGITYNLKVGDPAMSWVADHTEPGVSVKNNSDYSINSSTPNDALNTLSCIGNEAKVVSGEAEGDEGIVTGKHGGIAHILVHFPDETLEKLVIGDSIQIKSWGQGLEFKDYPEIKVMNIDPELLDRIPLEKNNRDKLKVPVTAEIPPKLMGSGLGAYSASRGDYDLTTADKQEIKKHDLEELRIGDLVAIKDTDNTYGRCFRSGAITIGIITHSDSLLAGHGPGITTILTSKEGNIVPSIKDEVNIANYINSKTK